MSLLSISHLTKGKIQNSHLPYMCILTCQPTFSLTSSPATPGSLLVFQPHRCPHCLSITASTALPLGLCTGCFLCLGCSSPRFLSFFFFLLIFIGVWLLYPQIPEWLIPPLHSDLYLLLLFWRRFLCSPHLQ